mmetsp:Transcript_88491/g.235057  ORF Transcript_88491/g.235057 Transcript_88491/m.235057 type:complete len:253 (+) Transcript_88491:286-1044(+)
MDAASQDAVHGAVEGLVNADWANDGRDPTLPTFHERPNAAVDDGARAAGEEPGVRRLVDEYHILLGILPERLHLGPLQHVNAQLCPAADHDATPPRGLERADGQLAHVDRSLLRDHAAPTHDDRRLAFGEEFLHTELNLQAAKHFLVGVVLAGVQPPEASEYPSRVLLPLANARTMPVPECDQAPIDVVVIHEGTRNRHEDVIHHELGPLLIPHVPYRAEPEGGSKHASFAHKRPPVEELVDLRRAVEAHTD